MFKKSLLLLIALSAAPALAVDQSLIEKQIRVLSQRMKNEAPSQLHVLSVEEMGRDRRSVLYRVNASIRFRDSQGEQTYQMRLPLSRPAELSDFFTTSYVSHHGAEGKEVKVSEQDLALMRQRAAEAGVAKGKSEPFAKKLRWVDSRQIGQSFRGKGAVIFSVQIGIQGSPVPWDLKVYVERGTYRTTVGFFD